MIFDKIYIIFQISAEVIIPTKSAISAATSTNLIFFVPIALVYTAKL